MRLIIIMLILPLICNSQIDNFNTKRHNNDKNLMIGLGSWAGANLIGSGAGWILSNKEQSKHFHQMNVMWNIVNIGIAIPSYLKAKKSKSNLSFFQTYDEQRRTEKTFLINAGIDIAYISSGLILNSESKYHKDKSALLKGFGHSLILQGSFLLIFDWVSYSIHNKNYKNKLAPILKKIDLSDTGVGVKIKLD